MNRQNQIALHTCAYAFTAALLAVMCSTIPTHADPIPSSQPINLTAKFVPGNSYRYSYDTREIIRLANVGGIYIPTQVIQKSAHIYIKVMSVDSAGDGTLSMGMGLDMMSINGKMVKAPPGIANFYNASYLLTASPTGKLLRWSRVNSKSHSIDLQTDSADNPLFWLFVLPNHPIQNGDSWSANETLSPIGPTSMTFTMTNQDWESGHRVAHLIIHCQANPKIEVATMKRALFEHYDWVDHVILDIDNCFVRDMTRSDTIVFTSAASRPHGSNDKVFETVAISSTWTLMGT